MSLRPDSRKSKVIEEEIKNHVEIKSKVCIDICYSVIEISLTFKCRHLLCISVSCVLFVTSTSFDLKYVCLLSEFVTLVSALFLN